MSARRLDKGDIRRRNRLKEVRYRRSMAIEASIRDPNSCIKHAYSRNQRRLIGDRVMPLSVLKRKHRMERFRFERIIQDLVDGGSIAAEDVMGNVIFYPTEGPITQLQDERAAKASASAA